MVERSWSSMSSSSSPQALLKQAAASVYRHLAAGCGLPGPFPGSVVVQGWDGRASRPYLKRY